MSEPGTKDATSGTESPMRTGRTGKETSEQNLVKQLFFKIEQHSPARVMEVRVKHFANPNFLMSVG